jgi:hypothetical protein
VGGYPKPVTCADLCEREYLCASPGEFSECPSVVWGFVDYDECQGGNLDAGVPLDIRCDDPLTNEFDYVACCCKEEIFED